MTALSTRARATTADALVVTRRRAHQDAGLLGGTGLVLLVLLVLTLALPRLVERSADSAVREAIEAAGTAADVVAVPEVPPDASVAEYLAAAQEAASSVTARLGAENVGTPAITLSAAVVEARATGPHFTTKLVHVTVPGTESELVRWVAGRAPAAAVGPVNDPISDVAAARVEVGLSQAAAHELGITLDSGPVVVVRGGASTSSPAYALVTGLYEPVDATQEVWRAVPELLGTVPARQSLDVDSMVGLYVPENTLRDMAVSQGQRALSVNARMRIATEGLTLVDARELGVDLKNMMAMQSVATQLPDVLDAFEDRLGAARAQASLTVGGIAATGALCLVLAAGLLVRRRDAVLATERARGASLASIGVRALVEAVPIVLVASGAAYGVVVAALPGYRGTIAVAAAVAVVAVLAPAVLACRAGGAAWAGRRVPADRRARARLVAQRGARRLAVESLVVALAVAALVSLRGRGLVPLGAGEVDPLLAAAPVLVAGAAALLVARIAPAAVRVAARVAARSRGIAGPLAAARAQGATSAVAPLLAVTVAVAVVVLSGTLNHSVRVGQQDAASQHVGAHARLDGRLESARGREAITALRSADGVDAVATGTQVADRTFGTGTGLSVTLLVVDAAELAQARAAQGLAVDPDLAALGTPREGAPPGTVPALVSGDVLDRLTAVHGGLPDLAVQVLRERPPLDVRGTTALTVDLGAPSLDGRALAPGFGDDDGLVVVDRAVLASVTTKLPEIDRAWVSGPDAAAAVAALAVPPPVSSGITVTTAEDWRAAWAGEPLTDSLMTLQAFGTGVVAALLALALVLVVVATARERGRTLSTLRTLGLDASAARAATLGELSPLVVGGLLGGAAIGLGVPWLVTDALGLEWLTGDPRGGRAALTAWPVLVATGALLLALALAVAVERLVRRGDRLGEVLRVGER